MAIRMLTARAAGVVLQNISQVDAFKASWMEEYFHEVCYLTWSLVVVGTCKTHKEHVAVMSTAGSPFLASSRAGSILRYIVCMP